MHRDFYGFYSSVLLKQMELQHIGAHDVKAGLRGSINDKEFQPVVMKFNRPQFITRLKQTCSEAMDKCGFKAGLKGSSGGWKCARFAHKQHKATHSLSLTVIFQHTLMKKDELSCQGSPSWSTNTPMTPCCASSSVAWPREECSHIWIQTQTSKHEKVLAGYLSPSDVG